MGIGSRRTNSRGRRTATRRSSSGSGTQHNGRNPSRSTAGRSSSSRGGAYRMGEGTGLNLKVLIASVIAGVVAWVIGNIVYEQFFDQIPRMLLIGIVFAILTGIILVVIYVLSMIGNIYEDPVFPFIPDFPAIGIIVIAAGIVVMLVLGSVFQWIYGLGAAEQSTEATSYVFVIDDSGSMEDSDPEQLRYQAIASVLEGMDDSFPYMVYGFSSSSEIIRDMAPISAGVEIYQGSNSGGTSIRGTLKQIISDYENKVWDGGARPRIILLTDGYATDCRFQFMLNKTLKQYNKDRISISTVGLGDVDTQMMETIAESTGGVFIGVSDANMLSTAMGTAAENTVTDRDLVSVRPPVSNPVLYAVLRIVFLSILGALLGCLVCACYGHYDSMQLILISSGIKAVAGALVMELGTNVGGLSEKLAWLILWILLAATIALKPAYHEVSRRGGAEIIR